MKKLATAIAITAALAAAATYEYLHASADPHQSAIQSRLHAVERTLSETQHDLLGYTTFTQYLEVTKKPSQVGQNSWPPKSTETTSMSSTSTGQRWASSRTPPSS
jgi:hypothetical protein